MRERLISPNFDFFSRPQRSRRASSRCYFYSTCSASSASAVQSPSPASQESLNTCKVKGLILCRFIVLYRGRREVEALENEWDAPDGYWPHRCGAPGPAPRRGIVVPVYGIRGTDLYPAIRGMRGSRGRTP